MTDKAIDPAQYLSFVLFLERACGIALGDSKQYLVRSRLSSLAIRFHFDSINSFIDAVVKGNREYQAAAIEAMTTNETLWFRDQYPFQLLEKNVLSQFQNQSRRLRVWSAACSSGQEAYSIAMTILNYQKQHQSSFRSGIEIIGTDISQQMVQRCKDAEYDQLDLARGLPEQFRKDYFEPTSSSKMKLTAKVRALANFRTINLLDSYSSLGRFDIVFCRNVLIYFSGDVKKQILQKIAACLQDGGILFLGASESIADLSERFATVRCNPGLYYLKKPQ